MKHVCILLIRFYRRFLSPLKSQPCCRFTPTCSAYALEAFQKRGFFIGMILTVARIFRCNPFFPGGYDPVPLRGLRNKKGGEYKKASDDTNSSAEFVFKYELELTDGQKKGVHNKKTQRED